MRLLRLLAFIAPVFLHGDLARAVGFRGEAPHSVSAFFPADTTDVLCSDLVNSYKTVMKQEKKQVPLWLESYGRMLQALSRGIAGGADKATEAAISTFHSHVKSPTYTDLQYIEDLSVCKTDDDGDTVLMKIIRLGLSKSLELGKTWTVFMPSKASLPLKKDAVVGDVDEPAAVVDFVNEAGDNLLHLAVRSGSDHVVSTVLAQAQKVFGNATLKALFEATNADGKTPVQLATSSPSINSLLSSHYRTLFFDNQ